MRSKRKFAKLIDVSDSVNDKINQRKYIINNDFENVALNRGSIRVFIRIIKLIEEKWKKFKRSN